MDDQKSAGGQASLESGSGRQSVVGYAEALHDVSNALTVLLGWLDEASAVKPSAPEVQKALAIATRKAREAQTLARAAIGARHLEEDVRALAEVVADVVDAMAPQARAAGVRVAATVDATAPQFYVGRSAAVGHVLTNLLLNALAFSPAGATISVEAAVSGDAAHVRVTDQGPGIPAGAADTIFQGTSARAGGSGIGLRHSREVMRAMGGDLILRPSKQGASFEATVPRSRDVPTPSVRSSRSSAKVASAIAGKRVLVVEDDRAVCALLDAGLGARGIEVHALHDARELESRIRALGPIDAVLLDLSPIAEDVEGALGAVRRVLPSAGIVFISGSVVAMPDAIERDTGRTRWVRKPFEVNEITEAIAQLLPRGG